MPRIETRGDPAPSADLLAQAALARIPKILTLLDRNPHSPTYGCGDRLFWHYRAIDFPSGMAQEFVWPLALAYDTPLPDNRFYREPALRHWVEAGIRYAASSAHADGSCDDYYPYERATGAAAFSLLACLESYQLLDLRDRALIAFFARRANWLAACKETGILSNHQALVVLCLTRVGELLETSQWERAKARRLERLLDWQCSEGWFPEYEGCDPGYQTLTVACLARVHQRQPDGRLQDALARAVELAACFLHPDGSYGGEYGSRNTYNFFPHGFELLGQWWPEALRINDGFLAGLARGLAPWDTDDRTIGHHAWNYLLAWRDFVPERPSPQPRRQGRIWLRQARILIDRRQDTELYLALNKGGTFKLFRRDQLVASDTQLSLQVQQGRWLRNAVAHLVDAYDTEIDENTVTVCGRLGWAKQTQMTPAKLLLLRCAMLTVGRFWPNAIRWLLQRLLIVGKEDAPFSFRRRLHWDGRAWCVQDELHGSSWAQVRQVGIGGHQSSIYVVMSRPFQDGQLQPWLDLSDRLPALKAGEPLRVVRRF